MSRINSAKYNDEIVDAIEVDDDYDSFQRDKFTCPNCSVKVAFNRGIDRKDPHFKNWPKVLHEDNCLIEQNYRNTKNIDNPHIETLVSSILPRSKQLARLKSEKDPKIVKTVKKRYFGRRSRKFLMALSKLNHSEMRDIKICTEDGKIVYLSELILRQDNIVEKLDIEDSPFVCILKGHTRKPIKIGKNVKIPMTVNRNNPKYKNSKEFYLFVPASQVDKNTKKLEDITNKVIYCYGIPEKNEYGYKIDLYSITHQIQVID